MVCSSELAVGLGDNCPPELILLEVLDMDWVPVINWQLGQGEGP